MVRRFVIVAMGALLAGCVSDPGTSTPPGTSIAPDSAPASASASASTPATTAPTSASAEPTVAVDPRWTRLDAQGPSAREDHTWTVDGEGRTAYVFGGRDGATVHADLWAFSLASDNWTRIDADGPAARFGHEAVWMDEIGLVVFAGQAGPTFFDDLWAFDPETAAWRELPSSGAIPTPRYGSCASVGPDGRLWISHGFTSDGTRFADTRAWDPTSGAWTDETPDGDLPVNRCLHGCWWTAAGTLALFGGQTTGVTALGDRWVLDDGTWARVEGNQPSPRNLYARTRHGAATIVFGGQAIDGSYLADAWWLLDDGGSARPVALAGESVPPGRSGAELIVDPLGDRLLLFGGRDGNGAFADLWQLTGVPPQAR